MSLFKAREWWTVRCGVNETFEVDSLCLCVDFSASEIDGGKNEEQIILTGSSDGYLRAYLPDPESDDPHSDLLLETQFPAPILALRSGRFSSTKGPQFAVLSPDKLIVCRISGAEESQCLAQYALHLLYEHGLSGRPFSLTVGPFGLRPHQERDYLCVQSLEGRLCFYEQEQVGIVCPLPDFLLPSPVAYVASTDSFVVCDSAWFVRSYRYHSMVNCTLERNAGNETSKLFSDWRFNLNEAPVDVQTVRKDQLTFVVVLGERNIYCLKESGVLLWTKKMDYHPMCLSLQIAGENPPNLITLVGTDAGTLLIYKQNALQWTCKMPSTALTLRIGKFKSLAGLLVTLSEVGHLDVVYLGTQPVEYGFSMSQRHMKDRACVRAIAALKQQLAMEPGVQPRADASSTRSTDTTIDLDVEPGLKKEYVETEEREIDTVSARVRVRLPAASAAGELRLTLSPTCPLISASPSSVCCQLDENGQQSVAVRFYVALKHRASMVWSTEVEVGVLGRTLARRIFSLPLLLAVSSSTPSREASLKITICTNQPTANLARLFADADADPSMTNAVALEHVNGCNVTVLASRQTSKYRLQSDSLAAMALPLVQLTHRLRHALTDLKMSLDSPMPGQQLWNLVEDHHRAHVGWLESSVRFNRAAVQLQTIQRLYHRKALDSLSTDLVDTLTLVQMAHDQVIEAIGVREDATQELTAATNALEAAINCVLSLAVISGGSTERVHLLGEFLLPVENSADKEQSWEKMVELHLNQLIHMWTNGAADPQAQPQPPKSNARAEVDMNRLKKRLLQVLDFVASGNETVFV